VITTGHLYVAKHPLNILFPTLPERAAREETMMSFLMLGSLLSLSYALAFRYVVPGEISNLSYWCGYAMCFVLAKLLASRHPQPAGDRMVIRLLGLAVPLGGVVLCLWGGMNVLAALAAARPEGVDMTFSDSYGLLMPVVSVLTGIAIVAVALYRVRR